MEFEDRFEVLEKISDGPRGEIHLGVDRGTRRGIDHGQQVILKTLAPEATDFLWEERQDALIHLYHPNIAPLLHVGKTPEGAPYLVRPRQACLPLHLWYQTPAARKVTPARMLAFIVQVCEALEAAHRRGIPHLNLKPQNILVRDTPEGPAPLLVDFALLPSAEASTYLAPEQLKNPLNGTISSDIYSVGFLFLFWLNAGDPSENRLAAQLPLAKRREIGDRWQEQLDKRIENLPAFLVDTIQRATSIDPADRHPSVEELLRELKQGLYRSAGRSSEGSVSTEEKEGRVDIRDGLIEALEEAQTARGPVLKFFVRHRDQTGAWARSGAFFYTLTPDDPSARFLSLGGAWRGAELSLYNASRITRGDASFYAGRKDTIPILEPYFPIYVTNVIKAQGCSTRYLTDLRDGGSTGEALVVGRIVHQLLEEVATSGKDTPPDFHTLYDESFPKYRLETLAAGLANKDRGRLKELTARHYTRLMEIVQGADHYPFSGATAEVKRFSGEYGLEGRTDLVFDDGKTFRVLELKTGSIREADAQQVRCYMLLWDKVATQKDRELVGEILYSKRGEVEPVQREDHDKERQIVRARNGIVSMHRHLAFGDTGQAPPWFNENPLQCRNEACRWRRQKCQFQTRLLGHGPHKDPQTETRRGGVWNGTDPYLVELARAYYKRFVGLVESEYWASNRRMGQILRGDTLPERIKRHKAVAGLHLTEIDLKNSTLTLQGRGLQVFNKGSEVMLHQGDFHKEQPITGRVDSARGDQIVIYSAAAAVAQHARATDWIIDVLPVRVGHREAHRALLDFLRTRDQTRLRLILCREAPKPSPKPTWGPDLKHLNARQQEAVIGAVTSPGAYLIQGPPGTGKTTVIAEIVRHLVDQGKRVLLAAATNTAVDNILARLTLGGFSDFIRLGSARSSQLPRVLEANGVDPKTCFVRQIASQTEDLDELRERITSTQVFAGTTHRAISSPVLEILERQQGYLRNRRSDLPRLFDVAILDEASQVTEPMALGTINRAERFVLVGDHQQLPPVITSDRALSAHLAVSASRVDQEDPIEAVLHETTGVRGLDRSLFERLIEKLPHTRLTEQYRMNRALMAFSSREFYEKEMVAATSIQDLSLPVEESSLTEENQLVREALRPDDPIVLMHTRGQESHHQNQTEAEAILEILNALLHKEILTYRSGARPFDPTEIAAEIGIISPFRAQVQFLRKLIRERFPEHADEIEVDTVERFQGREKEVMMVSFVTAGRTSSFLADHRRLNVTLTRARSKLILLGDFNALMRTSPLFRSLVEMEETQLLDYSEDGDFDADQ